MSQTDTPAADQVPGVITGRKSLRNRFLAGLILLSPVATIGLWVEGSVPHLLGLQRQQTSMPPLPVTIELPEMVANLNSGAQRPQYIKLRAEVQTLPADVEQVKRAMPRLIDLFQTYLREIRPAELQGALGTYRLREELMARAAIAVQPAKITDVLFEEILVQ
jgi:flagellar protein FliL